RPAVARAAGPATGVWTGGIVGSSSGFGMATDPSRVARTAAVARMLHAPLDGRPQHCRPSRRPGGFAIASTDEQQPARPGPATPPPRPARGAPASGRIESIDFARGLAVALMILSHGVNALLPFSDFPDWGQVPVHALTKFSSSLFV